MGEDEDEDYGEDGVARKRRRGKQAAARAGRAARRRKLEVEGDAGSDSFDEDDDTDEEKAKSRGKVSFDSHCPKISQAELIVLSRRTEKALDESENFEYTSSTFSTTLGLEISLSTANRKDSRRCRQAIHCDFLFDLLCVFEFRCRRRFTPSS
jgi:hypothetical protein